MENEKKKKKGAYGKVLGFCIIVGGIAALLGWLGVGGGLGLFGGNGNGDNVNGTSNGAGAGDYAPYEQDADYEEPPEDDVGNDFVYEEPHLFTIRVVYDRIYHGDEPISLEQLEEIIDETDHPGAEWELVDERAYVGYLDLVRALMESRGIVPGDRLQIN